MACCKWPFGAGARNAIFLRCTNLLLCSFTGSWCLLCRLPIAMAALTGDKIKHGWKLPVPRHLPIRERERKKLVSYVGWKRGFFFPFWRKQNSGHMFFVAIVFLGEICGVAPVALVKRNIIGPVFYCRVRDPPDCTVNLAAPYPTALVAESVTFLPFWAKPPLVAEEGSCVLESSREQKYPFAGLAHKHAIRSDTLSKDKFDHAQGWSCSTTRCRGYAHF